MDKRLEDLDTRVNERFDTLERRIHQVDGNVDQTRRDIRNWLVLVVRATSAVVTILQVIV